MRAAIFQCDSAGLDPARRLTRLAAAVAEARADLLVAPELFLSGYDVGEALPRLAEPADGPFAAAVERLARESGTAIVYGYPERDGEALYNSARAIGPAGPLANHRKLTAPPGFEARYFTPGHGIAAFDWRGARCALLICYDVEFPEAVRAATEAGAGVILVPTALGMDWDTITERVVPARAAENSVHLLYANHAGREGASHYRGRSVILGPDGRDLARAGHGEEVIAATLDPAAREIARQAVPYLPDLRTLRGRLA